MLTPTITRIARLYVAPGILAFAAATASHAAPPSKGSASADTSGDDHIAASLVAQSDGLVPGGSSMLGVVIDLDPGWYTYWRNPGDSGLAPRVSFETTRGITIGDPLWPAPQRKVMPGDLLDYVYTGKIALLFPIEVSAELEAGAVVEIRGKLQWFVCREACFVGEAPLSIRLPVRASVERSSEATMLDAMQSRIPTNAPSDGRMTARITDDRLEFSSTGVDSLAFFPYVDEELIAVDLIHDGTVEGDHLTIRYESFGNSHVIEGVLEIRRGSDVSHIKVAVPIPE